MFYFRTILCSLKAESHQSAISVPTETSALLCSLPYHPSFSLSEPRCPVPTSWQGWMRAPELGTPRKAAGPRPSPTIWQPEGGCPAPHHLSPPAWPFSSPPSSASPNQKTFLQFPQAYKKTAGDLSHNQRCCWLFYFRHRSALYCSPLLKYRGSKSSCLGLPVFLAS